jgi:lipopolysaccharide export LptBFGC system permease protein LptF
MFDTRAKETSNMTTPAEYRRKSQIAGGICIIAVVFLVETYTANRRLPNAASPFIWTVLVTVALIAGGLGIWFRSRANRD